MRTLLIFMISVTLALPALAAESPKEWFQRQTMPTTNHACGYISGTSCCDESDGRVTSVRPGQSTPLAAFVKEIDAWIDIPPETIIPESNNPMPGAVLWWTARCGVLCFADRTGL